MSAGMQGCKAGLRVDTGKAESHDIGGKTTVAQVALTTFVRIQRSFGKICFKNSL